MRSTIEATMGGVVPGTTEEERAGLNFGDALVSVDKDQTPQFDERRGKLLYSRAGVKGADLIFHLHMRPFPPEEEFRRLLAEAFVEVAGSIRGVEASWEDTSEFEEYPNMWAVRARGWATNALARDRVLSEFPMKLESILLERSKE